MRPRPEWYGFTTFGAMVLPLSPTGRHIFKQQALLWASAGFEVCCLLDSNGRRDHYSKFDFVLAAGLRASVTATAGDAFNKLETFLSDNCQWAFGWLGYDLKNETEKLTSANADSLQFADLYFFVPDHVITIAGDEVTILSDRAEEIFRQIRATEIDFIGYEPAVAGIKTRFSREDYIEAVEQVQRHIARGDIYETNFCQELYATDVRIDPLRIYTRLNTLSRAPFSSFFKSADYYAMCASPERFLARRGDRLISQPIKGTAPRGADALEDEQLINLLKASAKEQQENVMIVDLVRNDLTRCAEPGTVQVDELFGIYSFEQVHQMISTVTCRKADNLTNTEVIKRMFPMGSMTGAPKLSAMQLMEKYERSKRGLYSGAIGYFAPDGDFDFNVVIRSILYNAANQYASMQVGSAITHSAQPAAEYNECLLKARALLQALGASHPNG